MYWNVALIAHTHIHIHIYIYLHTIFTLYTLYNMIHIWYLECPTILFGVVTIFSKVLETRMIDPLSLPVYTVIRSAKQARTAQWWSRERALWSTACSTLAEKGCNDDGLIWADITFCSFYAHVDNSACWRVMYIVYIYIIYIQYDRCWQAAANYVRNLFAGSMYGFSGTKPVIFLGQEWPSQI